MLSIFCSHLKRSLATVCLAAWLALMATPVLAQSAGNALPLPQSGAYSGILEENHVNRSVSSLEGSSNFFEGVTLAIFSNKNMISANIVFGVVAIIYLMVIGIRFIISEGGEEEIKTAQKHFGYVVLGLFIISVAQIAGFTIFNPNQVVNPDYLVNNNVHEVFNAKAMQIKLFMQVLIGGFALLSIVTSAFRIMSSTGNEEVIDKEKQLLKNFFFATVLILASEVVVKGVFYLPGTNREGVTNQAVSIGIQEIMGLVNALLSITAAAAMIMLILASLYYVISLGEEERASRAKRIVFSTVIALIVIFSAYTILNFFLPSA